VSTNPVLLYKKGDKKMATHGPFKNKDSAKERSKKYRKRGFKSTLYKKANGKWYVSVTKA
jgi:hypothetical protein